jgi:3-deoxy-D-manno-octulosonic acid (KDO) 8-phosphate synthase
MNLVDFKKLTVKLSVNYVFKTSNAKLNLSTTSIKVLSKI